MLIDEQAIRDTSVRDIAEKMVIAARTAPKGKGISNLVIRIAETEDIKEISARLQELGEQYEHKGFLRDAENILNASVMVLLGTTIRPLGLRVCGLCGFENCEGKPAHVPCSFNTGDLGIAVGSAVSVAMDNRVDNRIMYSVGIAVVEMGLMGDEVKIVYAIPLSATSKNPFFDRG